MMTKTYVITGATSGIGKALLKRLCPENIVFAGFRNDKYLEELKTLSENVFPFYIDYERADTIKAASDYILTKCSKIDSLINIAGGVVAGPIERININELKRQFDVNTFGHLEFSRNLLNLLEEGKIINISSMSSFGIFPFIAPYSASKRCLDMLFNALLLESDRNVKIISIKPGVIATPLWEKSINENFKYLDNCADYEKEMNFLIHNARKNATKGLDVNKVVDKIIQIDTMKNPKLSYTIGFDAYIAKIFSRLPQNFVNRCIKLIMKKRVNS